jgi:hypothetical protein
MDNGHSRRALYCTLLLLSMPQLSALAAREAPTDDATGPAAAIETEADRSDLVDGLWELPLLEGGEDYNRRPEAVSYFTPVPWPQAWEFHADHLRSLGWNEDSAGSYAGDSGRQSVFQKDGAWINVGIWIGNVHDKRLATRVDISHAGKVAASTLPQVEPIDGSASCFPQVCVYRTAAVQEGLLQRLRERFVADGWQIRAVPADTQRSEQASATQLQLQRASTKLDIMIGPAPVEAGGEPQTAVQYAVSLAVEGKGS